MSFRALLLSAASLGLLAHQAAASSLTVIGTDAPLTSGSPTGGVVSDGNGGLLLLNSGGPGKANDLNGAILHLVPPTGGATSWTESVVYRFQGGEDGTYPQGDLLADGAGGYYGTTFGGGTANSGTFYHLTPTASGLWTHTVLYNFAGGSSDAGGIHGALSMDAAGNIYGTSSGNASTSVGGKKLGAVFELTPPATAGGSWTEQVIAQFAGSPSDGQGPIKPVLDASGNIYTDTISGGPKNKGEVVMLTPPASAGGTWTKTVLYSFTGGLDGSFPTTLHLVNGVLYGTTLGGGAHHGGTFFSLTNTGGSWTKTDLYDFGATGSDGTSPEGGRPQPDGSFIGATGKGGANGMGTYYKLTPVAGGFTETVLYSLTGGSNGQGPHGQLLSDGAGGFFDNTQHGGPHNSGVIVDFTP